MNKQNKGNIKYTFSSLINNNRFLLIFSFVIAFILWMWVAIEQSPEIQKVITDVPVAIKYENSVPEKLGLEIFGSSDFTVDITVTGKKYIVSSLTAEDFSVSANTSDADSSGKKLLKLIVKPKEENSDFTITSYSESEIEVFFDWRKEIELPINVNIDSSLTKFVPDNHKLGDIVPSVDRIKVSGPTTIINQINTLNANISIDEMLTKNTTKQASIVLLSKDKTVVDSSLLDFSDNNVSITLPVLKIVTLPTAVEFKNTPSYYSNNQIEYSISPSKVTAAIPVDLVDSMEYFVVDTIDFANIYNKKNTYKIKANESKSFAYLDDEKVDTFTVSIDASKMTTKKFTVPASNISVRNNLNFFEISSLATSGIDITVVGSEEALSSISDSEFYIVVDTTEQDVTTSTKTLKGRVVVPANKQCWAVGDCSISVKVEEK